MTSTDPADVVLTLRFGRHHDMRPRRRDPIGYWARRHLRRLARAGLEPVQPPDLWWSDNTGDDFLMNRQRVELRIRAGRT